MRILKNKQKYIHQKVQTKLPLFQPKDSPLTRSSVHQSRVSINMVYFGKCVRLSPELNRLRDEVRVFQQHCGGENLCVYRGMLHEGGEWQETPTVSVEPAD